MVLTFKWFPACMPPRRLLTAAWLASTCFCVFTYLQERNAEIRYTLDRCPRNSLADKIPHPLSRRQCCSSRGDEARRSRDLPGNPRDAVSAHYRGRSSWKDTRCSALQNTPTKYVKIYQKTLINHVPTARRPRANWHVSANYVRRCN